MWFNHKSAGTKPPFRGVNLGGWLVLERWITPSLFTGLKAEDETAFCIELSARKEPVLKAHHDSFIGRKDFRWIADRGLTAVRIPVGHWIFGDCEPYVGAIDCLDAAMQHAGQAGLQVAISLHGAPGSQNGWDHSGLKGAIEWHKQPSHMERTLEIIGRLAARYASTDSLWGIELLNEPHWTVPQDILADFYRRGYETVRTHCDERVAVVISDAFRPHDWQQVLTGNEYRNVVLDCHMYQCFSETDKKLSISGHLAKTAIDWRNQVAKLQAERQLVIGEWSAALDAASFARGDHVTEDTAMRAYAAAQLVTFEQAAGWFYWTYKTEPPGAWNFRDCVKRGWMPKRYTNA